MLFQGPVMQERLSLVSMLNMYTNSDRAQKIIKLQVDSLIGTFIFKHLKLFWT